MWQVLGGVYWCRSDDRTSNRHTGAVHCAGEIHFIVSSGLTWHDALPLALPATPPPVLTLLAIVASLCILPDDGSFCGRILA